MKEKSAFPIIFQGFVYADGSREPPEIEEYGLTRREFFAAKAMQGMLSYGINTPDGPEYWPLDKIPEKALKLADELIDLLDNT